MTTENEMPDNFDEWISEPVFGIANGTERAYHTFRIFKTTDGNYALQETWQVTKFRRTNPIYNEHRTIETGDLERVSAKHKKYTGVLPVFLHKS